jgi:hypothetical protein
MTFICYVPHTEIEVSIIEATGGEIQEFYFSVEELKRYCGDVDYTELVFDGVEIEYDNGDIMTFEDIKEN